MAKKALILTLALMMLLFAGCSAKPAEEKESSTQAQTIPFPAGDETSDEEPQPETEAETSEPQEKVLEDTVSEPKETPLPTEQAAETSKEQKAPQKEMPQSGQTESQAPAAQQTQEEQKPLTPPAEKEKTVETPITPPQAAEPEPTDTPEPVAPKSIYDYEFDTEAIRQELLSIGTGMGLTIDDSLTPDGSSWGNPVTASRDFQGAGLERSLKDYVRSMPDIITAYGGTPIQYFTIYVESLGGGSYRFYFLY